MKKANSLTSSCWPRRTQQQQQQQLQPLAGRSRQIEVSADGLSARRLRAGYSQGKCFCQHPVLPEHWVSFAVSCSKAAPAASDVCIGVGFSCHDPGAQQPAAGEALSKRLLRRFTRHQRLCVVSLPAGAPIDRVDFKVTREGQLVWRSCETGQLLALGSVGRSPDELLWPVLDICGDGVAVRLVAAPAPSSSSGRPALRLRGHSSGSLRCTRSKVKSSKLLLAARCDQLGYLAPSCSAVSEGNSKGFYAFAECQLRPQQELVLSVSGSRPGQPDGIVFGASSWCPAVGSLAAPLPPDPMSLAKADRQHEWAVGFAELPALSHGQELALRLLLPDSANCKPRLQLRCIGCQQPASCLPLIGQQPLFCFIELTAASVSAVTSVAILGVPAVANVRARSENAFAC